MQRYSPDTYTDCGVECDTGMLRDPSGQWLHERDPMWERLWVFTVLDETVRDIAVRADVLLSLDRAFRAWGGIE